MQRQIISVVLILLSGGTQPLLAQDQDPPAISLKQTKILIDSISSSLNRYYIFPDKALAMSTYVKNQLKKGSYNKITNPYQLAAQLRNDLRHVHGDPHMGVRYDPSFVREESAGQQEQDSRARELAFLRENNFFFNRVEILPGNVGYLSFTRFNHWIAESKPTLNAIFTFLLHTNALIIDLRQNHGGSPDMVRQIESYFFKERTHMMDIVDRPSKETHSFWADPADAGGLILSMPVYILTGSGTFSAAEDFSYGMQSVKRALIVGETTGGGAHPTASYNIGQGFVANIPFARSLNPYTNTDWEGTGVKPDIAVPASQALEKALEAWFTQQLAVTVSDQEKRSIRSVLNRLKADYSPEPVLPEILSHYTGVYEGGLDFYVNNGHFFCKNAERANEVFEVKALSSTKFVLDENVIVEFVKDQDGNYSSINMIWGDGSVSQKKRK